MQPQAPPVLPSASRGRVPRRGAKEWWLWGAGGLVLLAGAWIVFRFDPAAYAFYPQCSFYRFTGLDCPGCGGTRAVHALLHGDVAAAIRLNALFVALVPVGVWFGLRALVQRIAGRTLPHPFGHPRWAMALAGAVILFWFLRNLPLEILN